jgi:3-oxoadipate enol-lactonase
MPFLEIDGVRFHHRFDGEAAAPVLVLSNSLGTHLGMWDAQIPAFTKRFRVLRYDTRGHGLSTVSEGPYDIDRLGRDAIALLDGLEINRAHFCGLSLGGMTGMWLGTHAPERIASLLLCNTSAFLPPAEAWNARIEAVTRQGMGAIVETVLARWFTEPFRRQAPEAIEPFRQGLLKTAAPALVIAGGSDPATPPADGRFLAANIPGARYVELDAAHLSNIEQTAAFNDAALQFLSQ